MIHQITTIDINYHTPSEKTRRTMSRSYLSNATGGSSSHCNCKAQPPWMTLGRGGRVIPPTRTEAPGFSSSCNDIPEWHGNPPQTRSGQWQYHQNRNQNPYGRGYTNPPPPLYYAKGYQGPNTYQQEGRFVPPPYGQYIMGWGGPNPPQEDCIPNEAMDVDDTPTSNPRRMAPLPRRRSPNCQGPWQERNDYKATTHSQGGGRTSTKGKDKAMTEATNHQEAGEQTDQLTELLDQLSAADINRSMTDFLEQEELTSLVVHQLLDHIDCLQADLVREKKARCSTEAQLINTLRKQPASPPTDIPVGLEIQSIKKLRSDVGDGESISSFSDASCSIVQLHRFESRPASTNSASCTRGTAPSTQMKEDLTKFKTEKRVEHLLAPMVHKLPGSLPPTPIPLRAPGVAETPQLSSNNARDMSDDDKPLTKGQLAEIAHQKQIFQESRPGPIPDELSIIMIHQNYKRDNFFRGTVAHHFYLSPRTNTVYSGVTTVAAARAEYEGRDFVTPSNRCLYAVV
jgi:hypothetical protein